MWEFGSLQDSNLGLKCLELVLGKFLSLILFQNSFLYMLCISNSSPNYKRLRLGDWNDMDDVHNILLCVVCLWAFIYAIFVFTFMNWINVFRPCFFKRIRNFISRVGLGLGPLWCKLGDSLLIGWVYLGRHRGHVAYYVFSHLQFNALATFGFLLCVPCPYLSREDVD